MLKRADNLQIVLIKVFSDLETLVSLSTDACLSSIYRGYFSITAHWIDSKCKVKETALAFRRLPTPHTGTSIALLLYEQIGKWSPATKIVYMTTENSSDMANGICKLHDLLKHSRPSSHRTVSLFHVRFFAHVINHTLKEAMKIIHADMDEVTSIIYIVRTLTK